MVALKEVPGLQLGKWDTLVTLVQLVWVMLMACKEQFLSWQHHYCRLNNVYQCLGVKPVLVTEQELAQMTGAVAAAVVEACS